MLDGFHDKKASACVFLPCSHMISVLSIGERIQSPLLKYIQLIQWTTTITWLMDLWWRSHYM